MWYRVFASSDFSPPPEALLEHLHHMEPEIAGHFRGDYQGWFHAAFSLGEEEPIELERYLAGEEGIRAELNTWAAWLEEQEGNPHRDRLMRQVIQVRQIFTLCRADDAGPPADDICLSLAAFLAEKTGGIYQVDGKGFFAADGSLLVEEKE